MLAWRSKTQISKTKNRKGREGRKEGGKEGGREGGKERKKN